MIIRGKHLLLLTLVFLVAASWGIYWAMQKTADKRFAIGLYPEGPALPRGQYLARQEGKALPLDRPLVLRIERGTAGKSPFQAVGVLLGGDGAVLGPPTQMATARMEDGHLSEEAHFPPLRTMPVQRGVAAVVVRLPAAGPQGLPEIDERRSASLRAIDGRRSASLRAIDAALHRGGSLQQVLDRLVELGRAAGGQTEVQLAPVEEAGR